MRRKPNLNLTYQRLKNGNYGVRLAGGRTVGLLYKDENVWKYKSMRDTPSFRIFKTTLKEAKAEVEERLRRHSTGEKLVRAAPYAGPHAYQLLNDRYLKRLLK